MMMLSPRLSTMVLTQQVMVGASSRSGFITGLTPMMQTSLNNLCNPWSFYMSMQAGMRNNHTLFCVIFRFSRCLGKGIPGMKITRFWTPSTQRSDCYNAIRSHMDVPTSVKYISFMINFIIYGIKSTPLVLPRSLRRFYTGLLPRYMGLDILEKYRRMSSSSMVVSALLN